MADRAAASTPLTAWRLAAYGAAAVPLAMAALPIYVHVPRFYAETIGLDLTAIGLLLLAARVFDAVQDPLLGYWSDRARHRGVPRMAWVLGAAPLLALGMVGLFRPPAGTPGMLAAWLVGMLILVYIAFSAMQISYQAAGAELSADPVERTRVTAWREGLALTGVFLAAALPEVVSRDGGPRAGYGAFALLFVPVLAIAVALTAFYSPPPAAPARPAAGGTALAAMLKPLANRRFDHLLLVFVFNGIASAIPATLVLFFIADVIGRADLSAHFLIAYFAAGALGMPAWVWAARRWGKARAWLAGMLLSIAVFGWAFTLGRGDVAPFMLICLLSGLGLGADLALPPSLLADVIDDDERRGLPRDEGAYFGLWNLVTKVNLALAAGIALPLLAALGYAPGSEAQRMGPLPAVYALLPCLLKAVAVGALWRAPFLQRKETPA